MLGSVAAAFLAGALGSPHCAGMCGGFVAACGGGGARSTVLWHAGRLTTYAALGALAGGFGGILPGPAWVPALVSTSLLAWFALALAGLVPEPRLRGSWLARGGALLMNTRGGAGRYAFGLFNGLLPCGMVYAALSIPIALSNPAVGALAMIAFGLGTVPALTLLTGVLRRLATRGIWSRRAIATLVLIAGLWSIGMRMDARPIPHSEAPAPSALHQH